MRFFVLLLFFLTSSFSKVLDKEEIKNIITSASSSSSSVKSVENEIVKASHISSDTFFHKMSIKDFASLVSSNDKVNIMISDDVDATTSIYMYVRQSKLLPAFKLALSSKNYKLSFREGFYFIEKDNKKVIKSNHVYQLRSDIFEQIKPVLSGFEHSYISSSNRLVIKCSKSEFLALKDILHSLDRLRSVYNFKVTVFDLDSSLLDSAGVDTSILSKFTSSQTSFFVDILRVTQSRALPYLSDTSSKISFYSFIDFLSSKSLANIEVSTIVNTLDGVKSNIENVTRVPILKSSIEVKESNTKNTNSYDYQDIGSVLSIHPHYIDNSSVFIDFNFNYSVLTDAVRSSIDGNQYLPTYNQKSLNNIVRLRRGQAVVIGGFRRVNKSAVDNSVPVLSDIPFLGKLFTLKKQKKNNVITYVVIEYMTTSISKRDVNRKIKKFIKTNYIDLF